MTWQQLQANLAASEARPAIMAAMTTAVSKALQAIIPVMPKEVAIAAAQAAVDVVDREIGSGAKIETGTVIITDART